jgi:hypothetical protein
LADIYESNEFEKLSHSTHHVQSQHRPSPQDIDPEFYASRHGRILDRRGAVDVDQELSMLKSRPSDSHQPPLPSSSSHHPPSSERRSRFILISEQLNNSLFVLYLFYNFPEVYKKLSNQSGNLKLPSDIANSPLIYCKKFMLYVTKNWAKIDPSITETLYNNDDFIKFIIDNFEELNSTAQNLFSKDQSFLKRVPEKSLDNWKAIIKKHMSKK